MSTRVVVELRDRRHHVRTSAGVLRAQRLHGPDDRARIALVGQTALLLGGDEIELDVEVGPGTRLELSDIAGTVAYHGRGRRASWRTTIRVGPGGRLDYRSQPFVLSDGADVTRSLEVDLAAGAVALLSETVVYGRSGQLGGRLDATTVLRRAGEEFLRERLVSDAVSRGQPGVLSGVKRVDTVFALGAVDVGTSHPAGCRGQVFQLLDPGSTLTLHLS